MKKILFAISALFIVINCYPSTKYQTATVKSFDGTPIVYAVEGEGDIAVVFVHGWSCDHMYWENQIDHLMQNSKYKIVAIDLAGHGHSGMERTSYTIESFAKDVEAVANELNLNKIILIGHSMGGPVILDASRLLKDRLLGLIFVDTARDFSTKPTEEQKQQMIAPFKENFKEYTKYFVRSMFPPDADKTLIEKIAEDMSSAPEDVAVSAMENLRNYDPLPALKGLNLPVIAINSDMWPTNAVGNKKIIESFELKLMKGYGHFLMIENPAMFNQLLDESLSELSN